MRYNNNNRLELSTKAAIEQGRAELRRILLVKHHRMLQTTNYHFADDLAKSQAERVVAQLKSTRSHFWYYLHHLTINL